MVVLTGASGILPAGPSTSSVESESHFTKLTLLYLAAIVLAGVCPKAKSGMRIGPLITLIQIGVASQMQNRFLRARVLEDTHPHAGIASQLFSRIYHDSLAASPVFLKHVGYVVIEEYIVRKILQKNLKTFIEPYVSQRMVAASAIVAIASLAAAIPVFLDKGRNPLESRQLAVMAGAESLLSGVIAERSGSSYAIGARVMHNVISATLDSLWAYGRETIH